MVKQVPKTEYVVDQVPLTEIVTVSVPVTEPLQTATVETAIFENDSFPKDFVGLNGNYFFTAESSAYYTLETRTSDVLIGGLELWFSDGTEAGTLPINVNENTYSFTSQTTANTHLQTSFQLHNLASIQSPPAHFRAS